jgi:hypothetical protein
LSFADGGIPIFGAYLLCLLGMINTEEMNSLFSLR